MALDTYANLKTSIANFLARDDLTLTTENTGIGLVFYNDTYGWRILVDAYDVDPTEL